VAVAAEVASAILTANQAEGGFRVENRAGKRTQSAMNEEDPIEWTREARSHYRLRIGAPGDTRYLQGWHGPERGDRPWRWSTPRASLLLPVVPGEPSNVTLDVGVPRHAVSPESGLYLEGRQIAALQGGSGLTAVLPPSRDDRVRLELRCQGWVPEKRAPGSKDPRTLGVQGFAVTVRSAGAGRKVFDANTGEWLDADTAQTTK